MTPQTPPIRASRSLKLNSMMRIGMLVALIALIGIPLFSSSSASSLNRAWKTGNSMATAAMGSSSAASFGELLFTPERVFSTNVGPTTSFPLIMPQTQPTPAIATFESTCVTPDSEFNLGQTVCATATATGGSAARRRISWVDPEGFVRQFTDITTDPQNDTFTLPATPTTTFGNGQTVNNVGTWRVNIISSRGSLVASASFIVRDPANATADLSVVKAASAANEQVAAGSSSTFNISVQNSGPDVAQTVVLTDVVPANTSFVSMTQSSGPAFSCTTPTPGSSGTITCTLASLAVGASAIFDFAYTVNAGTPANTVISNTATISSNTNERNSADNSSTANAFVTAGGGGGETCTVSCPNDITTPANTTDSGGNPGAVVHFVPPTGEGSCGTITVNHCNDCFFPVGTTTVTGTADSGESCSFTVTVTAAGAPTITCPSDKTATADSNCQATVDPGTPTTTGSNVTVTSSRSDGKPLSDPYPAGVTTITWTATNSNGSASCDQTVTVNDTTDPTITCPADVTANNDPGQCSATIDPGTATATDNCGPTTVTGSRSDGKPLTDTYPGGTTTITWTATDSSGNQSSCTQTITVTDNQSPTITLNGQTPTLWPPNHKYRTFQVSDFVTGVSDNCGAISVNSVVIAQITSDENENGNGDGNTLNDIVIAPDCKSFQLRAEREGNGNGRVYTIVFSVSDPSGNTSTSTARVVVPKNPNQTAVDSGPHYIVTSNCP